MRSDPDMPPPTCALQPPSTEAMYGKAAVLLWRSSNIEGNSYRNIEGYPVSLVVREALSRWTIKRFRILKAHLGGTRKKEEETRRTTAPRPAPEIYLRIWGKFRIRTRRKRKPNRIAFRQKISSHRSLALRILCLISRLFRVHDPPDPDLILARDSKMGLLGQRAVSNPSAVLSALVSKRDNLQDELRVIERQIYDLETTYLQDSNQNGSVLKGFEGFLSSSKSTANLKRSRRFQPEDRLFSLSSITSPVREGRIRSRSITGGGTPANGQGKPKKGGRISLREGKRLRPSIEQELDDEEDLDIV
ncbi:Chromatin modification-related protein [Musa troglodytarum]|uniref:Chromatin modification-related protein n=1 Tax=Musa troglodytarum TaxID=320322 RepID=A0A9E7L4U6_9LILI|nr:Chromatin modification-related protein [Musa troglodytarum]